MTEKALFLDLDGTLLTDDKQITRENMQAVANALAAGHRVVITTGRPLTSGIKQARRLGLYGPGCFLIAYNGGMVYDTGQEAVLYEKTIPLELTVQLFRMAGQMSLHIQTYDRREVVVDPANVDEALHRYCDVIQMSYRTIARPEDLEQPPVKLLAISWQNPQLLQTMADRVLETYPQSLDAFFSSQAYLEIVPAGTSKGAALKALAERLHIPLANTIAVGDAPNDLSMLRMAGLGVAMANATDQVRAAADYVTRADNNHSGVAEVISQFLL